MLQVILHRGPQGNGDRVFDPEPDKRAWQRAEALAELHATRVQQEGSVLHVHAEDYYTR